MVVLPGEHGSSGAWLPEGIYHYDRMEHKLCQIQAGAPRPTWQDLVPAMQLRPGGRILWLLVGDTARVAEKYAARGLRFLLLEAGHLMQNLCLMSIAIGGHTVPLGGALEDEIASQFRLLHTDHVLYCGLFGMAS